MDMQGALRTRLLAACPRVYWVQRPQGSALPAIVLNLISDPRAMTLKGEDLRAARVQMNVMADSHKAASDLAEAAIAAAVPAGITEGIRFERGIVDSARDLGEQTATGFIHMTGIDLIVRFTTEE